MEKKTLYVTEFCEQKGEVILIYEFIQEKIRIFGEEFVKNNENNFKIIFRDKNYSLKEFCIFKNFKYNKKIKIKLI